MNKSNNKIDQVFKEEFDLMLQSLKYKIQDCQHWMKIDPEEYTDWGCDEPSIDVRLCVEFDGQWIFRTGLSDYDQRHSTYCGASSIGLDTDAKDLLQDLISQINEQRYQ